MAGRGNKKDGDNFEKMKKEMTTKRMKADKKANIIAPIDKINDVVITTSEVSDDIVMNLENNEHLKDNKINPVKSAEISEEIKENNNEDLTSDSVIESNVNSLEEENKIEMVVFRVGEEEFAIKISEIKEIIRIPSMIKVPSAPFYVEGLCALRGELLPVVNSHKLFGMTNINLSENCRIVIVDINGKSVGLITDKVSEVISIEKSTIKEPPSSIKDIEGGVINGLLMLKQGKRIVMILDASKIIKVGTLKDNFNKVAHLENSVKNTIVKLVEEEQIIVFNVGREEYSFPIDTVKEIIRFPDITKVPNTPEYIEGVFSIRNKLLAIINLGGLLGTGYKKPDEYTRVIIISTGELTFGVVVDKVSQVMRVSLDSLKKSNISSSSTKLDYIRGFFNLNNGNRLIINLEANKLISMETTDKATRLGNKNNINDTKVNTNEMDKDQEQIVIFKLDGEEYGIRVNNVKEINIMSAISYLPGAPVFIEGMVNLRGDIIPVLNLRTLFGFQTTCNYESSRFLVVEYKKRNIGIIIDSATEVMKLSKALVEEVSKALEENEEMSYIDSIAKLEQGSRIVLLLNLKVVLSFL